MEITVHSITIVGQEGLLLRFLIVHYTIQIVVREVSVSLHTVQMTVGHRVQQRMQQQACSFKARSQAQVLQTQSVCTVI